MNDRALKLARAHRHPVTPNPNPPACHPPACRAQALLSQHGLVCVTRGGADTARLLDAPGSLLNKYRAHVAVVEEPVPNEISSSRVSCWAHKIKREFHGSFLS